MANVRLWAFLLLLMLALAGCGDMGDRTKPLPSASKAIHPNTSTFCQLWDGARKNGTLDSAKEEIQNASRRNGVPTSIRTRVDDYYIAPPDNKKLAADRVTEACRDAT